MRELDWGIGRSVVRSEDARLSGGLGRYTDDIDLGPAASLYLVRSPHAAARIVSINVEAARAVDGVLAVLSGVDVVAANIATLPSRAQRHKANGEPNFVPPYYPLAVEVAPHSGVAVVAVRLRAHLVDGLLRRAHDLVDVFAVRHCVLIWAHWALVPLCSATAAPDARCWTLAVSRERPSLARRTLPEESRPRNPSVGSRAAQPRR